MNKLSQIYLGYLATCQSFAMADAVEKLEGPVIGSKEKSVGWYDKEFSGVPPHARDLLIKYSNIPPEQVDEYALQMVRNSPLELAHRCSH